ncbi:hypothetical protein MTR_2g048130 [Medicago truncatula]|uniref:Uncharacterized protein n=1 Tax=Medicago truncatula TaxID=3880 RepID=G7ISV7_MEDTR|nr:hypothetical protein MTR_2g048130 [Medicago truncatula]
MHKVFTISHSLIESVVPDETKLSQPRRKPPSLCLSSSPTLSSSPESVVPDENSTPPSPPPLALVPISPAIASRLLAAPTSFSSRDCDVISPSRFRDFHPFSPSRFRDFTSKFRLSPVQIPAISSKFVLQF